MKNIKSGIKNKVRSSAKKAVYKRLKRFASDGLYMIVFRLYNKL